jgi:tetratricopeptide (TPR) repeat protein/TolB-like protein
MGQMKQRRQTSRNACWIFLAGFFFFWATFVSAQTPSTPSANTRRVLSQSGIYLVFPFENVGAPPNLDWIGEGLEELTIQRLSAAGQQVYSHAGRLNEMDVSGFPPSAKLSRATMLRMAQELDADYVIFGTFTSDGKRLTVDSRVLRVSPVALLPVVNESGPFDEPMTLHARLAWRLLRSSNPNYPLSFNEFFKMQRPLTLAAFEQYVRGLLANDDDARLRYLKEAARLAPDWPDPDFAIGEVYFQKNDCNSALPWFGRVPLTHARSVEAIFATGVCRLQLGQPDKAEATFTSLQEDLRRNLISGADLPEILNNLALAQSRMGTVANAKTELGRARDIDPDEDDYPFNLGLLTLRENDYAASETHFREARDREPDNAEDVAFLVYTLEKQGKKSEADGERDLAVEEFGPGGLPALKFDVKTTNPFAKYERVKRELDTTSLRLELEGPETQAQVQQTADASVAPPKVTPAAHLRLGRQELGAGRLDPAEKEFRAALATDPHNASAHRELAEIYRRRGKLDDAVQELQLSLAARDSAAVHTILARIYLEQKKPDLAKAEVEKAVRLAPNYLEAKELLEHLEKNKSTGGTK